MLTELLLATFGNSKDGSESGLAAGFWVGVSWLGMFAMLTNHWVVGVCVGGSWGLGK